jgi:hypothetical protein
MAHASCSMFTAEDNFNPSIALDNAIISISQPPSPSGRASASGQTARAPNRGTVNIYVLPSETTTRNLIAQYFGDTGLLFPYIHEQTFLDTYNDIKGHDFNQIRRTWLGLLNMVMAMATSTTIVNGLSAERRARESNVYYQRARGLCEKQIMRGTSLEIGKFYLSKTVSLANNISAISTPDRSIPSRDTEIRGGMDSSRSCSKGCLATRPSLYRCFQSFFSSRSRVSKANLVRMRRT